MGCWAAKFFIFDYIRGYWTTTLSFSIISVVVGPLDFLYRLLGGRIVVFVLGDIRNASIERFSVILWWEHG